MGFIEGSHHKNASVFILVQNFFSQMKGLRTLSLNAHYLILMRNPRDNSQIMPIARQIDPNNIHAFLKMFRKATINPYSYLLIDVRQETVNELRFRSNIFRENNLPIHVWIK